jgi:hypothetical protein
VKACSRIRECLPLIGLITAFSLIGAGCGSGSASSTSAPSGAAPDRPATTATLEILSPGPNEHTGAIVDVRLHLERAQIVPFAAAGGVLRPDRGHIHLTVDGQLVSMPLRLEDRLPRLTPGNHTLQAEFVAADHLPFSNRVVAAVTFRVG